MTAHSRTATMARVAGLAATLVLGLATSAHAAVIGSVSGPSDTSSAANNLTAVQAADGTGPSYVVPAGGGIITRWRVFGGTMASSASGGTFTFELFRPQTGGAYKVIAADPHQVVAPASDFASLRTISVPAHVPVSAGDRIGVSVDSNAFVVTATQPGAIVGGGNDAAPPPGATYTPAQTVPDRRLQLEATVEPDADHDGFGDLSEDACPKDPKKHAGPCVAPDFSLSMGARPGRVTVGKTTTLTVRARELRGGRSDDVRVAVALPEGFAVRSVRAQHGQCSGRRLLYCRLGAIAAHGTDAISVKLKATAAGRHRVEARIVNNTTDTNAHNDAAATTLKGVAKRRRH